MQITSDDLLNLPVYTNQGRHLGRVSGLDLDIDSHAITNYRVRTGMIKGLWHQELLVAPSQVISISKEKMIVEDNAAKRVVRSAKLATSIG